MRSVLNENHFDKDVLFFLDNIRTHSPFYLDTYEAARAGLSKLQIDQNFEDDVLRQDYDCVLTNGESIHFRIVRDKNLDGELPVVFYIHGGGWITGDAMAYDALLRNFSKNMPVAMVFVEYTLAPRSKYPKPLQELFFVFEYVIKNSSSFGLNKNQVIFMGDDAGGNMATVLSYHAKKMGYPIVAQVLLYPILNGDSIAVNSLETEKDIWFEKRKLEWFFDAYEPDINKRKNPYVSPVYMKDDVLKQMPFTFILTAEHDITNRETKVFEEKLRQSGVEVFSLQINATIHDFLMLNPLVSSFSSKMAFKVVGDVIKNKILHAQYDEDLSFANK